MHDVAEARDQSESSLHHPEGAEPYWHMLTVRVVVAILLYLGSLRAFECCLKRTPAEPGGNWESGRRVWTVACSKDRYHAIYRIACQYDFIIVEVENRWMMWLSWLCSHYTHSF